MLFVYVTLQFKLDVTMAEQRHSTLSTDVIARYFNGALTPCQQEVLGVVIKAILNDQKRLTRHTLCIGLLAFIVASEDEANEDECLELLRLLLPTRNP